MDELTLLRKTHETVAEPSTEALTRGRAALFEKIGGTSEKPARRRHPVRWAGLGALGAGALVVTLVATDVLGLAGWRGGADPAAAEVLHNAALETISASDPVVGEGQYLLVTTTAVYEQVVAPRPAPGATEDPHPTASYLRGTEDKLYVPADTSDEWVWDRGTSEIYQTFGAESEQLAQDDMKFYRPAELVRAPAGAFYGTPPSFDAKDAAALPRDPHRLLNYIYRGTLGTGPSPDGEALVFIADRLRSGTIPADLRAVLYQAAALIPGVQITQEQANLDGRTGIAIGRVETTNNTRTDLIIDPDTGQFIGEREIDLDSWFLPAGTPREWTSVQVSVVDSAPEGGTLNGLQDFCHKTPEGLVCEGLE